MTDQSDPGFIKLISDQRCLEKIEKEKEKMKKSIRTLPLPSSKKPPSSPQSKEAEEERYFILTPSITQMNISAAHMNKDQGNLPKKIILKDQYGNDHWQVEVEKQQNELFLAKGWEKFVQENHLQVGDSVVFYHICPNVYEVVLLGRDSCDKEGVGSLKSEEEEVKGEDEVDEEKQNDSFHH